MGPRRHRGPRIITRRALIALAVVLTGCSAASRSDSPAAAWPEPPPGTVSGHVTSVIDGDSLRVEIDGASVEIRLAGVNAPEHDECHSAPAADTLRQLIGRAVSVNELSTDQYGRSVADVWTGSAFVNGRLVEEGEAIAMATDGPSTPELIAAEESARSRDVGLWNPDACGERIDLDLDLEMTQPDPRGPDNDVLDEETVTIHNRGREPANLSGFVLRDESTVNRLRLPEGTAVPAGGALTIRSGCGDPIGWCSSTAIWNNGGDSALLLGPQGTVVAHVRYHPSG